MVFYFTRDGCCKLNRRYYTFPRTRSHFPNRSWNIQLNWVFFCFWTWISMFLFNKYANVKWCRSDIWHWYKHECLLFTLIVFVFDFKVSWWPTGIGWYNVVLKRIPKSKQKYLTLENFVKRMDLINIVF